ncbi:twin transmembrane helix small protein [bacterium SCSIO 12696]|nr:twin transmembrane helix small protein [bacterium SCSIO 12696]
MWLKIVIVLLLIAMVVSLTSGLVFLFKDLGSRKRTLYALGIRIGLAALLVTAIVYGVHTGELSLQAPWHGRY